MVRLKVPGSCEVQQETGIGSIPLSSQEKWQHFVPVSDRQNDFRHIGTREYERSASSGVSVELQTRVSVLTAWGLINVLDRSRFLFLTRMMDFWGQLYFCFQNFTTFNYIYIFFFA